MNTSSEENNFKIILNSNMLYKSEMELDKEADKQKATQEKFLPQAIERKISIEEFSDTE